MKSEAARKLLNHAYFYLRFRARTVYEMRIYLDKKAVSHKATPEDIESVLQELQEMSLLDDRRFVQEYVASRSRNKPRSRYALTRELLRKGVDHSVISAFFTEAGIDEEQLARTALQKVWGRYHRLEFLQKQKRATDYLRRRGFSFSVIQKVIKAM